MNSQLYFDGKIKDRHVADLTAILYAVRGERDYWNVSAKGHIDLRPDMTFDWKDDGQRNQSYLQKKTQSGKPNDRYIESVLDPLLIHAPQDQNAK